MAYKGHDLSGLQCAIPILRATQSLLLLHIASGRACGGGEAQRSGYDWKRGAIGVAVAPEAFARGLYACAWHPSRVALPDADGLDLSGYSL